MQKARRSQRSFNDVTDFSTHVWCLELRDWVNRIAQFAIDIWMALIPRTPPGRTAARNCKIVAHRGAHNYNKSAHENTMRAFELARSGGVWGIEADIRWTADLVPVIIHDPDTRRVFGKMVTIRDVTFGALRKSVPEVPSLSELVAEFGGKTHLMLELKREEFPDIERQKQKLRSCLAGLKPKDDYHILALDPELFEIFDIEPRSCCVSVAMDNTAAISARTLESSSGGIGGIAGHYLLLNDRIKQRHIQAGQKIGTGFIRSRNCLYREMNRGVEWIFSNEAVSMQQIVDKLVKQ
jgi:glycerophosphoryl diester phosphodiesterase